jgi:hypothetical protein
MPAPTLPLAPIRKGRMAHGITSDGTLTPHLQCWYAVTADGQWGIERAEMPGTPWLAFHLPSIADGSYKEPVLMEATLRTCRSVIASGLAARTLAMAKCSHPDDQAGPRADLGRGLWSQHCGGCGAVRYWHTDRCPSCRRGEGHDWTPED